MKKEKISLLVFAAVMAAAMPVSALGVNAAAKATVNAGPAGAAVSANLEARITKGKDRADQEIDRRINALNVLNSRVQAMVKLTADSKASVNASIQSQISALTALKAKIDADTDLETLKADIKSITASYRIYLLVIPQGRILVAADKLKFVASEGTDLAAKISARIEAAAAAGKDVSAQKTMLADMQAKLIEISVQADAAASDVQNLKPDNGDEKVAAANTQALKGARTKIHLAMQDVDAVRKDAKSIIAALAELHVEGTASSSSSL